MFNPATLEAALRELLSARAAQPEQSQWSRAQLQTHFNLKTIASQIDAVYQRACHP